MSENDTTGDDDDFDLPAIDEDTISTGAAADSADWDERLKGVSRILRYAMLVSDRAGHVEQRLIAEIDEACPRLPENAAWVRTADVSAGLALASELDRRAVADDEPNLRSLADCVRLLCLPTPRDAAHFTEHRRVAKALQQAFHKIEYSTNEQLCADLERFVFGWAALPACSDLVPKHELAAANAVSLGTRMADHRIEAAKTEILLSLERQKYRKKEQEAGNKATAASLQIATISASGNLPHKLVVVRLSDEELKNNRLRDILAPFKSIINVALPLVEVPPLHEVRSKLLFEFPYAANAIDFALADLVGRTTVHLDPLLIVGKPGAGKSLFARRIGEILLGAEMIWRTDASRADSAVFAGTDRRWSSAEPCHPFLAIAQSKIANPFILLEELDKAPTRSETAGAGRIWDCLLGFLSVETSTRYPDPACQKNLNLSQCSFIATANSLDPLPGPIRDRFRVVSFPSPGANDIDALLPAVIADLARERGLTQNWVQPLDGIERTAVARYWRGGSVRRLRRVVEAILRDREARATRN
jgi:ATP-dependent Lon protease